VAEVFSGHLGTQRRRSERVSKSLPVIVRGIDLLGQPFEERTATLALNLHGCRYASKHHLPKNTWVTLEVPQGAQRRHVRARVAWIQRPHSVREFFQIAVELDSPANIWGLAPSPSDWQAPAVPDDSPADAGPAQEQQTEEAAVASAATDDLRETLVPEMTNSYSESSSAGESPVESATVQESPLLRQWSADMTRQAESVSDAAARAAEQVQRAMRDFENLETRTRENLSAEIAAKQQEFLAALRAQFEGGFQQTRELLNHLDSSAQSLRAESQAAQEATSRMAQSRLQIEAAEAARAQLQPEPPKEAPSLAEGDVAHWRHRLEAEMAIAQGQWTELLQSSIDGSLGRLVEQLSGHSQELLRNAEQKVTERFAELRQPLGQMYAEARETLGSIRSGLEEELGRARSSLGDIEHAASRMKEYSAQLEAASHDTLNELHRRLENILQAQTEEMGRRAEHLLAGLPQRLAPTLDSLGQQLVERTMSELDTRFAPRLEHASEILRGLTSRETEADDNLRLQRERLRQVADNNLREATAQAGTTLAHLRNDFEAARKEALAKWNEELDASSVRASHSAAESIGRSSEWFQQEARARLQVLVEQAIGTAASGFEEKTVEAARQFEARLEEQSSARVAQIHAHLDGVAEEITGRTRTQLEAAAEAAAASFGQVLRRVSDEGVENFTLASRSALSERERELGGIAERLLQNLEANGEGSIDRFRAQMASQLQASVVEGRSALAAEFASAFEGYRADRDAHQKSWSEELQRLGEDAVAKHQERLQNASDAWVVSSVRRLNEHGQNAIELLMRSADQSLRDSCAKLFEGLSEMLRDRSAASAAPVGFSTGTTRDVEEAPAPHNELANGANA